jgi:hypothetical protein
LKALPVVLLLVGAALLCGGCADPLEQATVEEVPAKLQRGITGNGTLGPIDRSNDPNIRETHP